MVIRSFGRSAAERPNDLMTCHSLSFCRSVSRITHDGGNVIIIIIIIIITDLYSAFRSEDTEALDAAQED